jgi:hypothetical protein
LIQGKVMAAFFFCIFLVCRCRHTAPPPLPTAHIIVRLLSSTSATMEMLPRRGLCKTSLEASNQTLLTLFKCSWWYQRAHLNHLPIATERSVGLKVVRENWVDRTPSSMNLRVQPIARYLTADVALFETESADNHPWIV